MRIITERTDLHNTYVIVRTSCNVPLVNGKVGNMFRLKRALPTITWLREQGAKVILIAHIGRGEQDTLRPVFEALQTFIPLTWAGVIGSEGFTSLHTAMQPGEVIMAENLRQDIRETQNDITFVDQIASYGEVYVNDAFDNIHREHASMVGLPTRLPAYAGITLAEEVSELSKTMQPTSPSLFILGGAKFETKLPLIEKYLAMYDQVFVGGALLNDILLAQGYGVGKSLVSPVSLADALFLSSGKLIHAVDVVVRRGDTRVVVMKDAVEAEDVIVDIGPATVTAIAPAIASAKTILWNGPMGLYEHGVAGGTEALAECIAEAPGFSVLGGGDTIAAIEPTGRLDRFGFVSIGGGAMLTFLEHGSTTSIDLLT